MSVMALLRLLNLNFFKIWFVYRWLWNLRLPRWWPSWCIWLFTDLKIDFWLIVCNLVSLTLLWGCIVRKYGLRFQNFNSVVCHELKLRRLHGAKIWGLVWEVIPFILSTVLEQNWIAILLRNTVDYVGVLLLWLVLGVLAAEGIGFILSGCLGSRLIYH